MGLGRTGGDAPALVISMILLSFATSRVSDRGKSVLGGALAVLSIASTIVFFRIDGNPFAMMADAPRSANSTRSTNPALDGTYITQPRKEILDWLTSAVTPGSTCFVYGNLPVLYTLLSCTNPTRIDSTAADFIVASR